MSEPTRDELLALLHRSQEKLARTLGSLTPEQLAGPSYDDDWSIGQVASHLGSGAEIFTLFVEAGIRGDVPPDQDSLHPIWDRWNAKSAAQQGRDAITADAAFLDRIDGLTEQQRARWQLEMFGQQRNLAMVLQMRLAEHAVHTWDIAVAIDPAETVAADAVELLVDTLDPLVARAGKPADRAQQVRIVTDNPARTLLLEIGPDGARLSTDAVDGSGDVGLGASVRLPAEAFLRLVYGRLDAAHTPPVQAEGVDLDVLRRVFPGF